MSEGANVQILSVGYSNGNVVSRQKFLGLTGEIIFMPLNLIKPYSDLAYPKSGNYRPLIEMIKYDPKFEPIMQYVFGKIVIAKSMENYRQDI